MNVTGHFDIDSIHKAGEPFPYRPDALSGYYMYDSDSFIEDWGHAFVLLKKYDSVNQRIDTIGYGANTMLNPANDYRFFSVEIDYLIDDVIPDSVVVAFFSTYPRSPTVGGVLYVDKLAFEYATNKQDLDNENLISIYPNPARSVLHLSGLEGAELKIYNSSGAEQLYEGRDNILNISSLSPGLYILIASFGDEKVSRKFIKK